MIKKLISKTKQMLSFICVITLVCSCLFSAIAVNAEAVLKPCYFNDFETTYSANEFTSDGNVSNDKTVGYNSLSSAKIVSSGFWPVYTPNYKTEIGKKYRFSFWYKVDTENTDIGKSLAVIRLGSSYKKWLNIKNTAEKNATWTQFAYEFTATKTDCEINIQFYSTSNAGGAYTAYIDGVTVLPSCEMSILSGAENGKGEVNSTSVFYGESASFTAMPNRNCVFVKWIDENGMTVSTDNPYVVSRVTSDLALKPVFEKTPLTDEYDFESALRVQDYYIKSNDATVSSSDHNSGNSALKLNTVNDYFSPNFILKAGESYNISFYYKTTASNYISAYIIPLNHGSITQWGMGKVESYLYSVYSACRNVSVGSTAWKKFQFETVPTVDSRLVICGIDGYLDDLSINDSLVVPEEQLIDFEDCSGTVNNFFSYNTDKKYTHNNSGVSLKFDGTAEGTWSHTSISLDDLYTSFDLNPQFDSYTTYEISLWVYCTKNTSGSAQINFSNASGFGTIKFGTLNKWIKYTFTTTTNESTSVTASLISRPGDIFYMDDLTVSEIKNDGSYCEPFYNVVDNGDIEYNDSQNLFSDTPDWIIRNEIRDETNAANGGYYLTVNGSKNKSGEHYLVPIKVPQKGKYRIALSMKGTDAGNVKVAVTSDKNGTLLKKIKGSLASSEFILNNTDGNWSRDYIIYTVSQDDTILYLDISGTSGVVYIDAIQMFRDQYAKLEDQGDYTVYLPYDYDSDYTCEHDADTYYINDFETTFSSGEFTNGGTVSNDKTIGYNSSSSAEIVSSSSWPVFTPNYKTEIGKRYSFSFWYKTDTKVTDKGGSIAVVHLGTAGSKFLNFKDTVKKNSTWTEFTGEFTATKTDCEINIQFYPTAKAGGEYSVYIDRVKLAKYKDDDDGGLIDFEDELTNGIKVDSGFAVTNECALSGNYSLKVGGAGSIYVPMYKLEPGKTYRAYFSYKSLDEFDSSTYCCSCVINKGLTPFSDWKGYSGNTVTGIQTMMGTSGQWTQKTFSFKVPDDIEGALLSFYAQTSNSAYIDDIRVCEVVDVKYKTPKTVGTVDTFSAKSTLPQSSFTTDERFSVSGEWVDKDGNPVSGDVSIGSYSLILSVTGENETYGETFVASLNGKGSASLDSNVIAANYKVVLHGDVNLDGEVNCADIVRLKKILCNTEIDAEANAFGNDSLSATDLSELRLLILNK